MKNIIDHGGLIKTFLKTYSTSKSMSSFSYLIEYYFRNNFAEFVNVLCENILLSKNSYEKYMSTLQRLYSETVFSNNPTYFGLVVNSPKLNEGLSPQIITDVYENYSAYLKGDGVYEKQLKGILEDSVLFDKYKEYTQTK